MSNLSNRLHAWALNNEMIDTHFTEHGCDCVSASELLVQQDAEIERLRRLLLESYRFIPEHGGIDEQDRCGCIVCQLKKRVREALGE